MLFQAHIYTTLLALTSRFHSQGALRSAPSVCFRTAHAPPDCEQEVLLFGLSLRRPRELALTYTAHGCIPATRHISERIFEGVDYQTMLWIRHVMGGCKGSNCTRDCGRVAAVVRWGSWMFVSPASASPQPPTLSRPSPFFDCWRGNLLRLWV